MPMPTADLPGWAYQSGQDFTTDAALGQVGSVYGADMRGYDGFGDTSGNGTYDPDLVLSVSGSVLDFYLHTEASAPRVACPIPFGYGGLTYGRFAVRLRADSIPGYKIAFLLWPTSDDWADGEIDWPETGELNDPPRPASKLLGDYSSTFAPPTEQFAATGMSGWHTAVIEWAPDSLTFLWDDAVVAEVTDPAYIPTEPMRWTLQAETVTGGSAPAPSASGHLQVDWVAQWTYSPATLPPYPSSSLFPGATTFPSVPSGFTGAAAQTLPSLGQAATGSRTVPAFPGTAAQALPELTQAATGARTVPTFAGIAAQTMPGLRQQAAGGTAVPVYTGTAGQALPSLTQDATGTRTLPVSGSAAQTLPRLTQAAAGTATVPSSPGQIAQVLPSLNQTATGTRTVPPTTGAATQTLPALGQALTGSSAVPVYNGTAAQTLPSLGQTLAGTYVALIYTATIAQTLPALTQRAVDGRAVRTTLTATLAPQHGPTAALAPQHGITATLGSQT